MPWAVPIHHWAFLPALGTEQGMGPPGYVYGGEAVKAHVPLPHPQAPHWWVSSGSYVDMHAANLSIW